MIILRILCGLCVVARAADVSAKTYRTVDPKRENRVVVATIYLQESSREPKPAVAFGHGFGLGPDTYPLARELAARKGIVVLCPHSLGVLPPHWTTELALDQVFLLEHVVQESKQNASSPFFGRVANLTAVAGHSLGGGSTILAADPLLAGAYSPPTAIFTVSLGVYTIPSALESAPRVPPRLPALLFTATEDCVDPPAKNSLPVYDALISGCAAVVSVVGGSHCQWADSSLGCQTTEKLCGAHPNKTREMQMEVALQVLLPFLAAAFAGDASKPWKDFQDALHSGEAAGDIKVLAMRQSSCLGKTSSQNSNVQVSAVASTNRLDTDFPEQSQRLVLNSSGFSKRSLKVTTMNSTWSEFLVVKPKLQLSQSSANITIVAHAETGPPPFSHSIAIKMKNVASLDDSGGVDNVTCADLHRASLASALRSLSAEQRQASERLALPRLRFGADIEWHTGLWVPTARITVSEQQNVLTVTAPKFYTSAKLPVAGGMLYCRLLPPEALREWILKQLPAAKQTMDSVVV